MVETSGEAGLTSLFLSTQLSRTASGIRGTETLDALTPPSPGVWGWRAGGRSLCEDGAGVGGQGECEVSAAGRDRCGFLTCKVAMIIFAL